VLGSKTLQRLPSTVLQACTTAHCTSWVGLAAAMLHAAGRGAHTDWQMVALGTEAAGTFSWCAVLGFTR